MDEAAYFTSSVCVDEVTAAGLHMQTLMCTINRDTHTYTLLKKSITFILKKDQNLYLKEDKS